MEVAAVARDVTSMFSANERTMYRAAAAQEPGDAMFVRFEGDAREAASRVRAAIGAIDPNALTEPRTLTSIRRDLADRFMRLVDMILFLALVAFVLAIVGIYGAVAFSVSRRTKEIGIRVALGATSADVACMVVWSGFKPIALGIAVGFLGTLVAGIGLVRVFRDTPVKPDISDPAVYVFVTSLLAVTGIIAMVGPCWRSTSADPVLALHHD